MKNHRKVGVANDIRDLLLSVVGLGEVTSRAVTQAVGRDR